MKPHERGKFFALFFISPFLIPFFLTASVYSVYDPGEKIQALGVLGLLQAKQLLYPIAFSGGVETREVLEEDNRSYSVASVQPSSLLSELGRLFPTVEREEGPILTVTGVISESLPQERSLQGEGTGFSSAVSALVEENQLALTGEIIFDSSADPYIQEGGHLEVYFFGKEDVNLERLPQTGRKPQVSVILPPGERRFQLFVRSQEIGYLFAVYYDNQGNIEPIIGETPENPIQMLETPKPLMILMIAEDPEVLKNLIFPVNVGGRILSEYDVYPDFAAGERDVRITLWNGESSSESGEIQEGVSQLSDRRGGFKFENIRRFSRLTFFLEKEGFLPTAVWIDLKTLDQNEILTMPPLLKFEQGWEKLIGYRDEGKAVLLGKLVGDDVGEFTISLIPENGNKLYYLRQITPHFQIPDGELADTDKGGEFIAWNIDPGEIVLMISKGKVLKEEQLTLFPGFVHKVSLTHF